MRRRWLPSPLALTATLACGGEPAPAPTDVDGLLQRIDAMERRLDSLEDANEAAMTYDSTPASASDSPLSGIQVQLPPANPAQDLSPASLRVHVSADELRINGEAVTIAQARERFEQAVSDRPETRLVLLAEPEVPHKTVVKVLELAKQAGLKDIAISARVHGPEEREPKPR